MWDASGEDPLQQADGSIELLTSIIPIRARGNCSGARLHARPSEFLNTSIGRPLLQRNARRSRSLLQSIDDRHIAR